MPPPTHAAARATDSGPARRAGLALACGLVVGVATSFGQTYLDGPPSAFANSASAWLLAPFLVGACMRSGRGAALAGLAVCACQLLGYYGASQARGFSAGGAVVVFWAACAVAGGPVFGAAGRLWRSGPEPLRGLGPAVLASAFLAEGGWVYGHVLHRAGTAALWLAIGALIVLGLTRGRRERRWLALTVPVALAGELVLGQVYAHAF